MLSTPHHANDAGHSPWRVRGGNSKGGAVKTLALVAGVIGVLVILAAVIARFHGAPTIALPLLGKHTASATLIVGNTLLLIGIFLLGLSPRPQPDDG